MSRCVICGAKMDKAGRCTRCKWQDPARMREPTVSRCPVCGGDVANGVCMRCAWREA